tara:strand:+ start:2040 stop:2300 length:261 start_codon:yes stop_codon:yes gene_type:complete
MKTELNCIYTDLLMLEDGSWVPDEDSINDTLDNVRTIANNLGVELKDTREEEPNYKKGFEELMCYFDSISDEEKPKLNTRLKKLGL